ncbi:MAG: SAM-dependent methyltransferase [Eubacterium sp.]|nr:SAM-dependent methyltransferase [Eubacterium sp.]
MAKKEVKTDLWVYELLKDAGIELDPQGSSIKEIDNALKSASKKGTGKVGFPEYVGVVKDYIIVIEDKPKTDKHVLLDGTVVSLETKAVTDYAVNGALFYAKHLANNTSYKKVIAIGVSGDEKKHKISPLYVDETEYYRELPDVESFISFNEENIDEYYTREVLKEDTNSEKELAEILKDAAELHEDLRNYGNLKDIDKPLVVSGILLALNEIEKKSFSIDNLVGDTVETDGQKIYKAIESNLKRVQVQPQVKLDKILSQFSIIRDTQILNEINDTLGETPLKYYAKFLYNKIFKSIKYTSSSEDYLGRFYGEFMSYSGGDGQTLGIVLTPKHITELFCEILDIKREDIVLDPCCGTAGFLIAAMHYMFQSVIKEKGLKTRKEIEDDPDIKSIRKTQLHGIELQPYMFTIATTNMILRGDGKSNLINENFLKQDSNKLQLKQPTVGMMNPPYSQGSKKNSDLYEICFTEHLLDSLVEGGRCAVIVPQSSMTGKTKEEQAVKENILKKHTLEGVITLNKDTFYGVGVMPCIAVFTAGEPHPREKECKFINFENDGYKVSPHIGLIETESAKDKKQHLLDVWFDRVEADTKFCVKTSIGATDEWLHSFYYFNDEIPTDADFDKTVGDYLSFEFSMIMQGRQYLFGNEEELEIPEKG